MADMKPQGTQAFGVYSDYEKGDANIGAVVSGLGVILASTLVVMATMFAMFNFLNKQADKQDEKVPPALARSVVPPSPRLLPNPYTDRYRELEYQKSLGQKGDTPDGLPWDKRTLEIAKQHEEANPSAASLSGNSKRIPVAAAMELMAGAKPGEGTPSVMPWEEHYAPTIVGGADGTMNLTPGKKRVQADIFDNRPVWESPDERFNADSSGGLSLEAGGKSRVTPERDGWSR